MTPVELAALIVSVVLTISRFIEAAKPVWGRLPKPLAVVAPAVVMLTPQVVDLMADVKTSSDLTTQIISAVALVIVNVFPRHDPPAPPPSAPAVL